MLGKLLRNHFSQLGFEVEMECGAMVGRSLLQESLPMLKESPPLRNLQRGTSIFLALSQHSPRKKIENKIEK